MPDTPDFSEKEILDMEDFWDDDSFSDDGQTETVEPLWHSDSMPDAPGTGLGLDMNDEGGRFLASMYAELWTILDAAGVEIPDEERAEAHDELANTGYHVVHTRENGWQVSEPDVQLAEKEYRRDTKQDVWIKYVGPHGGQGWKNLASGQIVYGQAQPNAEDTDLQQRTEDARKFRLKVRRERPPQSLTQELFKESEKGSLNAQLAQSAKKAGGVLQNAHGDQMGKRIAELGHLAGMAFAKLPDNRGDLKARLQQIMKVLVKMQSPEEEVAQRSERSQFMPKRSTS